MTRSEQIKSAIESAVSERFYSEVEWEAAQEGFSGLTCHDGRAGFLTYSDLCQTVADASGRACYMLSADSSSVRMVIDADLSDPAAPHYPRHCVGEGGEPFFPSEPEALPAAVPLPAAASREPIPAPAPAASLSASLADIPAPAPLLSPASESRVSRALRILDAAEAPLLLEDLGELAVVLSRRAR